MQILTRGRNTFYIQDHSVVVGLNGGFQYTSYNVYPLQNRKPFYDFREEILNSDKNELTTSIDIIRLALKYRLAGTGTSKPKEANDEQI